MPRVKYGSPEDHARDRRDLHVLDMLRQGRSQMYVVRTVGMSQTCVNELWKAYCRQGSKHDALRS